MFGRNSRPPRDVHVIDNGNVGCPLLDTDVGIDRCFACAAFLGVLADAHGHQLKCRPRRPSRSMSEAEMLLLR